MTRASSAYIVFQYTNWRGKTEVRTVSPIRVAFESSPYHSEPQWFLVGRCHDRQAERKFALIDCRFDY